MMAVHVPFPYAAEDLISEAVCAAHVQRLVKPGDYVVCLKSVKGSMVVKVVQVGPLYRLLFRGVTLGGEGIGALRRGCTAVAVATLRRWGCAAAASLAACVSGSPWLALGM